MPSLKRRMKDILDIPSPVGNRWGRVFDITITVLIAANAAAVVLETVGELHARYGAWFRIFELTSLAIFGVEYVLRIWVATEEARFKDPVTGRIRFALTPMAIVDLLAILPALLTFMDLRVLRVLRLARLLKIGRYSESLQLLTRVVRDRRAELAMSLFVVALALVVVSSLMYYVEHDAQPEVFSSIPAAMWWGIVTLSTTGFGDVVPITPWGRVLGGLSTLLGVGLIALPVGILAGGFVEELNTKRRRLDIVTCPHCHQASVMGTWNGRAHVEIAAPANTEVAASPRAK